MFKIREFSKFTRISVKMLRHYDELGLLKPIFIDPQNNYRYYSSDQLTRLNRIIALKDLGFQLGQISRILDEELPPAAIRGMFQLRRAEIEQNLQQEQERLTRVEIRLRDLKQDLRQSNYDVVIRQVEPLLVASMRDRIPQNSNRVTQMFEELEDWVAQHQARAASTPLTIYHDEEYQENDADTEVCVPILRTIPVPPHMTVRELLGFPSVACVVYTGDYGQSEAILKTLMVWIEAHGYRACGSLREVYVRFGADSPDRINIPGAFLTDQSQLYITEIQLPIEKINEISPRSANMDEKQVVPGLKEIGQIAVSVHDLTRAIDFYRKTLGMNFLFEIPGAAFFDCSGIRLMLSVPEKPEFDHPASIIYYRVDDIQQRYEVLTAQGVIFEGKPHLIARMDQYDLWMAFLRDTEDNLLALMSEVGR